MNKIIDFRVSKEESVLTENGNSRGNRSKAIVLDTVILRAIVLIL